MSEQKVTVKTTNRKPAAKKPTAAKPATKPEKKGLLTRAYDKANSVIIRVRSTRGGRAVIRISKGAAAALGLYGAYRLGQKSIKPTTVYIAEGIEEPAEEAEASVEPDNNEESVEVEHD